MNRYSCLCAFGSLLIFGAAVACRTVDEPSMQSAKSLRPKPKTVNTDGFNLAGNGKEVRCVGPDNISLILNAQRTTLKFTIEGESSGPQKITKRDSDGDTYVSYTTKDGVLRLDDQGNTYSYYKDSPWDVNCN